MSSIQRLLLSCLFMVSLFGKADVVSPRYMDVNIPPDCYDVILPDTASYALFIVDDKGFMKQQKLLVKSFRSDEVLWSVPYSLEYSRAYPVGSGVLVNSGYHTVMYDYATGKKLHKFKASPAFIDTSRNLLVGFQGDSNNKLVAYDLTTGKQVWKTKIEKNFGHQWVKTVPLDSNTAIYNGGDLWKLDITTGECKNFKVKRRIFDKKANAITGTLSVIGAVVGALPMYSPTYFAGLGSNVLTEPDGKMYVADRDAVICVDTALNELWRTPLPEKSGSRSYIRMRGDTIEMLNTGQAVTGVRDRNLGEAFIASFNKNTGDLYRLLPLAKEWDQEEYGKLIYFVNDPLYAYDYENEVISLVEYPAETFPIVAANGDVSVVDHNLTELKRYPLNDIFYKLDDLPQGTALTRIINIETPEIVIINDDGKIADYMDGTAPLVLRHNDHIVTIYNGSLIIHQ